VFSASGTVRYCWVWINAHSAGHALAVTDAALAAHFDFENLVIGGVVRYDCHVSMLKIEGFIRGAPSK
jgi:hypothetical protein